MIEIKKGDVVGLKSGGVAMTVESLGNYSPTGPEDGVACVWYEDKKVVRDVFDRTSLRVLDM